MYHDDVTSAFLNGIMGEKVLLDQPDGYIVGSAQQKWELQKTLYGLKQSPREWNNTLYSFLTGQTFKQSKCDPCLYFNRTSKGTVLVGIYVDDIIATGSNDHEVQEFRKQLKNRFKNSEGGVLDWCLGMKVVQSTEGIKISQKQYILGKLEEFESHLKPNLKRLTPLDTYFQTLLVEAETSNEIEADFPYRSMVGSLSYASTGTRPDIATAVGIVKRFLANPKSIHCEMVRQIWYYLRQFPDSSLNYARTRSPNLIGYCDASWANKENFSSISGFAFILGSSLVAWSSKKQPVIALSSTEAEYVTATSAAQESVWFSQLLAELGYTQSTVTLY